MKKLAIALGIAGALAVSQAYAAPAFTLAGGYTGPIKIKFSNWESFSAIPPSPGVENFGILSITQVLSDDGFNTVLWSPGQNGGELTGVFRDIIVKTVTPIVGGFNVKSTGGLLDLYINPVGAFAAAGGAGQGSAGYAPAGCAIGDGCYNGVSNAVGGGVFLNLAWGSGIDPADGTITVDGNLTGATFPTTGNAQGFLDVIGGPFAGRFDTNAQPTIFGPRDMFAQNIFCVNGFPACTGGLPIGDWQLVSEDPVRARVIPEPGTLALLGISLLGLVGLRRKKSV